MHHAPGGGAVVIVGATGSVGRALAARFSRCTAGGLVLVARDAQRLDALAKSLGDENRRRVAVISGDVCDTETARRAVDAAVELSGGARYLAWATGAGVSGAVQDFSDHTYAAVMGSNAAAPFYFARECLARQSGASTSTSGGEAVAFEGAAFTSSITARRPVKFDALYSAAKAANAAFARSLHDELAWKAKRGLLASTDARPAVVLSLTPSFIEGPATEQSIDNLHRRQQQRCSESAGAKGGPSREAARQRIADACPGGRILRPEEIADTVAYALTDPEGRRWCAEQAGRPVTLRGMPMPAEIEAGTETSADNAARRIDASVEWIRRTVKGKARGGLVVPLSGGTDSTVAFALCACALGPTQVRGVHFVPGGSGDKARQHPETTEALLRYCREHVGAEAEVRLEELPKGLDAADPDMLRWAIAASDAKRRGAWLVGTRNRTEQLMGTYSVASTAATLQPLLDWWKADVMAAAAGPLGVPASIVASSHAADPDCGRPAEMAAVGLAKIDWFVRCEWSGQRWRLGEHVSEAEAAYLSGIQRYNGFKAGLPIDPRPWHDHEPRD